jgi:hypothetical protein
MDNKMKKENSTISKIKKEAKAEIKTESSKVVGKKTVKVEAKKVAKFTYKNLSTVTLNDKIKIEAFLKKENVRVTERMKERNIKISDVIKVNKFHQQQFLNGILKGDFIRYWFFLKDGEKQMFNFSKSYKADTK